MTPLLFVGMMMSLLTMHPIPHVNATSSASWSSNSPSDVMLETGRASSRLDRRGRRRPYQQLQQNDAINSMVIPADIAAIELASTSTRRPVKISTDEDQGKKSSETKKGWSRRLQLRKWSGAEISNDDDQYDTESTLKTESSKEPSGWQFWKRNDTNQSIESSRSNISNRTISKDQSSGDDVGKPPQLPAVEKVKGDSSAAPSSTLKETKPTQRKRWQRFRRGPTTENSAVLPKTDVEEEDDTKVNNTSTQDPTAQDKSDQSTTNNNTTTTTTESNSTKIVVDDTEEMTVDSTQSINLTAFPAKKTPALGRGRPIANNRAIPGRSYYAPWEGQQRQSSSSSLYQPSRAYPPSYGPSPSPMGATVAILNLISLATKIFLVKWMYQRMTLELDLKSPVQHYTWECLNDKYAIDTQVWGRILQRKPMTDTLFDNDLPHDGSNRKKKKKISDNTQQRWNQIVKDMTRTKTITATATATATISQKTGTTNSTTSTSSSNTDTENEDEDGPNVRSTSASEEDIGTIPQGSSSTESTALSSTTSALLSRDEIPPPPPSPPLQTVIVIDMADLDMKKLRTMISFLVTTHSRDVTNHRRTMDAFNADLTAYEEEQQQQQQRHNNTTNQKNKNWFRRPSKRCHHPPPQEPPPSYYHFGPKPEVVLLVESPGGEVTKFGLQAALIKCLADAGFVVTVCVDQYALSGGYMIASQASQILASPFAYVGSIGVYQQTLNYYHILKKYGVQSLTFKAGDQKNSVSEWGEVTSKDIANNQRGLDMTHEAFIDMCLTNRPQLDRKVCNGRVLFGTNALNAGMIDRVLTSEEYILEHISGGKSLVMKLHPISGVMTERSILLRALEILPHLSTKVQSIVSSTWRMVLGRGSTNVVNSGNDMPLGGMFPSAFPLMKDSAATPLATPPTTTTTTTSVDLNSMISTVIQGVALLSMIQRAVTNFQRPQH
jgi:hypothetical protein